MTKRERNNPEWQALITEHQILKRKLQSKSEALLILSKDLERAQSERDQFKMMAEKLQERCQAYKRQHADFLLTGDKAQLIQMMKDIKNQKTAFQRQSEILQQKLNEATGDVKLLREKFARQTVGDEGIGARHFPVHERERLVSQLEQSQQQCEYWHREYESQVEVANEAIADRDGSREKADRLNQELSRVLSGDKTRIVDIDALCMENKYLQDRVAQCLAEKNTLHAQIEKYKKMTSLKRTSKNEWHKQSVLRTSDVISPKHLRELLSQGLNQDSSEKISDLQSIVSTLLETVNDKNLALYHLRNTNKILGNRVSDLELKLKTYEVSGLWNIQGSNGSAQTDIKPPCDLLRPQRKKHDVDETSEDTESVSDENFRAAADEDKTSDDKPEGSANSGEQLLAVEATVGTEDESEHLEGSGNPTSKLCATLELSSITTESSNAASVEKWLKSSFENLDDTEDNFQSYDLEMDEVKL